MTIMTYVEIPAFGGDFAKLNKLNPYAILFPLPSVGEG